jgi:ArsR family transcriptional regulator, lead/cadmium/zinc/bismuth-responsive transcriptional repressor
MKSKRRTAPTRVHDRIPARRLAALKRSIPDGEELEEFTATFGLLGDPRRLRMLAALREEPELCVCDLAEVAGMEESAASHALRLLRAHGVVRARRSGRMVYYSLRDGRVRGLLGAFFLRETRS